MGNQTAVRTLVTGCRCAPSWGDLDLTFDLTGVTMSLKILSRLYLGNLVGSCRFATSWCDFDLTFHLVVVTMSWKILSGIFLGFSKV